MPWEKSFDEDEILNKAMELFWQHGYKGVSMNELVGELGVNRSSLYATYGQKEDLFLRALTHYDRTHRHEWLAGLSDRYTPIESIRRAFSEVAEAPERARRLGCLLVNTSADLVPTQAKLSELIRDAFEATESFFREQLEVARQDGSLPRDVDTASLAAALMALFLGLRVLARTDRPAEAIQPILSQVDTMLRAA